MSAIDDRTRILHMIDASRKALEFTRDSIREDLDKNELLQLALVKLIESIGEAVSSISPDRQAQHPEIPWPQIIAMRNRLVHAYFSVNLDILWQTIQVDIPLLIPSLEKLLDAEI
ncbi:MAG: HepT-like ribonuclease domain-containing protein [Cyanobacteriota bacterium]|nr:HepT-like ribonuclease domain-containing protein [Cyanobacteriota bacterium]